MLNWNKFKYFYLLTLWMPLLGAVNPINIQISGIEGEVLLNVQHRLNELYKDKALINESPSELTTQIARAMYPYGFFNPQIILSQENKIVHIIPGRQMLITSLLVKLTGEGANNPKMQDAVNTLPIKTGQPLNNTQYEDAKEKLSTTAESLGYLHATFEKSEIIIDQQQYTAKITLLFNTGPQYYYGQIRFEPTYISPKLLHRYVPFNYGQTYSTEQILTLNTNLAASGYFKTINIKPMATKNHHVPIDISLQPSNRFSYTLGAGYGTDTGPRGLAGLHIIPINRLGHKFNAIAQGSLQENTLQAQYIIPGFNPVIDNYSISGGATNLDYNIGRSNALLLTLAQQHVLTDYQRILSINGLHERFFYKGKSHTAESRLFYPKAILSWNKTTDRLFSPSGYNITINGLAAAQPLLSSVNLAQIAIDAKAAITIDPIRTRLYLHTIQGTTQINNVDKIPISIAQLLGGAANLKGYNYNSIGPGKIISYSGVEIQKETFKKWYLLGFLDSGDVYNPNSSQFKYDMGIGLMWVSPIGPIKVAVAQAVDNHLSRLSEHTPRLVINMGPDLS